MKREADIASGFEHDSIIDVFAYHEDGDLVGYAMELAEGHTLGEHLENRVDGSPLARELEPSTLRLVRAIAEQIESALTYIHGRGYVHRDIKPSNILIEGALEPDSVRAKLTDFGITEAIGGHREELLKRSGTWEYMAPDLRFDRAEPSPATDRYALGVVLFQLLTHAMPPYRTGHQAAFSPVQARPRPSQQMGPARSRAVRW